MFVLCVLVRYQRGTTNTLRISDKVQSMCPITSRTKYHFFFLPRMAVFLWVLKRYHRYTEKDRSSPICVLVRYPRDTTDILQMSPCPVPRYTTNILRMFDKVQYTINIIYLLRMVGKVRFICPCMVPKRYHLSDFKNGR